MRSLFAGLFAFGMTTSAFAGYPTNEPIPSGVFSADVVNDYRLFSSTDSREIFYLAKRGQIAVSGSPDSPLVDFSADYLTGTYTPFINRQLLAFGGSYTSSGNLGSLSKLLSQAATVNKIARPLPVTSAENFFALRAGLSQSGSILADCKLIKFPVPKYDEEGNPVVGPDGVAVTELQDFPDCKVPDPNDPTKKISTNFLIEYGEMPVFSSDSDAIIPFQGVVHPANSRVITNKLAQGANWSNVVTSSIQWKAETLQQPFFAELLVNWKSLTDLVWVKAQIHNNACVDIQVDALFGEIKTCDNRDRCGVEVRWYTSDGQLTANGGKTPPPVMAPFAAQVKLLRDNLQRELFDYLEIPEPEDPSRSRAIFTVRANYRKLAVERNEVIPVYYFPPSSSRQMTTTMSIDCVKGAVGGPFEFAKQRPACAAMLPK